METNTPMGILRMGATSQAQIDTFSDQLIESVKSGEAGALEVLVQLKAFEKVTERVIKEIKDNCLREAELHPETTVNLYGADIQKSSVRTEYDYGVCKDHIYLKLFMDAQQANFMLDERKAFLRALKTPITLVDDSTGEVSTIYPPAKKVTDGLKISFK